MRYVDLAVMAMVVSGCLSVTTAGKAADDPHADLFATTSYPSAVQCGACHPKVFSEWSASNHAYASISPMFHKFEQAINTLASGTIGSFCVRCHQQVGTQRGEPRETPLWERSAIAREGVTCITCHRVKDQFGKVNGERQIVPGDINKPIYNAGTGNELANVLADPDEYGVSTKPGQPGRPIHGPVVKFEQISKSEFCVSCHQVAVHPGIKLEVVWDQYRDSPAARSGVTCQECHMGKVPGEAKGFDTWPIAIVNGKVVGSTDQKHSNHMFHGPGYPIAHPGLFPFNPKSLRWEIREWLAFDYRSEWGKPDWEKKLAGREIASPAFPAPWQTQESRTAAREVLDQNVAMLEDKRQSRIAVMENGSRIDGPFFDSPPKLGERLKFRYRVTNVDTGHNLPSGSLGAQPEIWLNVVLLDPDGKRVFESGYVDGNGDMADLHSLEVAAGKIKLDDQLFNLQSKFLTTNVKGTDREMYLPVNFDIDQIPHIRPSGVPTTVLNHPPFIRMESRSLPPLGWRDARYKVDANKITKPGRYTLQVRMRSRAEPIYFMKFVGATRDMEQSINEWMIDIHPYAVTFEIK
ncbi:multiheme c-type cytochrome [Ferrovibrio sp.]|uniref:multiheme c-type cytochrome n=1 Tax=Ferrovibrio sp. TaxID=1917215 RepID=UPI000CBDB112|nr:multiheme c-type cytochrome [Ferrovibrio sp.]PJI43525.1 MAG: cytochrome C [Ferrovibrio sp.]